MAVVLCTGGQYRGCTCELTVDSVVKHSLDKVLYMWRTRWQTIDFLSLAGERYGRRGEHYDYTGYIMDHYMTLFRWHYTNMFLRKYKDVL